MYYFQINNDYIDKYKVNVDIAKLTYIYNQLIEKCSFIESISATKESIEEIKHTDDYNVKDYHYKMLKNGHYELQYKRYNKCELAKIIEIIFRKDIKGIYKLFEYNPLSKEELNTLKINELSNKIDKIDNTNPKEKIKLLKEMEFLLKKIENNKNQKDEKSYLEDAKKLITFEYIQTLKISDYELINNFFEKELNNNISNKKLIKKEN